ncbi:hypothetical protein D1007_44608 [Hordeum vulgare]|nr:hypothetical protein D1007_44608 [Hordeum vulgare]
MADARWVRAERRATRIAQTAPVSAAGVRRSSSPVVNAGTGLEVQEKHGSSQPATEPVYGRTATLSLARPSRSASRARPKMPHDRCTLAMATELLHYRPARDRHDDWLHRIEELITVVGYSSALSCSLRPQPSLANNDEEDAPPPPRGVSRTPSPGRKRDPAPGLVNPGQGPVMNYQWEYPGANTFMPFGLENMAATYQRLQPAMLVPRLLGRREEEEEMLGPSEGPEPREAADP